MAVINFEIFKVIGTLSEDKDGWKNNLHAQAGGNIILNLIFVLGIANIQV